MGLCNQLSVKKYNQIGKAVWCESNAQELAKKQTNKQIMKKKLQKKPLGR